MNEKSVLRIYMTSGQRPAGEISIWRKLFGPGLGGFLLRRAKEFGIEQAVFQKVFGGYLEGHKLVFDGGEVTPTSFPHCVELVDVPEKISGFVQAYREQLEKCRIIRIHAIDVSVKP